VNIISSGANHSIVVGKSITTNETVVYGWDGKMNGALGENERSDVLRPILLATSWRQYQKMELLKKLFVSHVGGSTRFSLFCLAEYCRWALQADGKIVSNVAVYHQEMCLLRVVFYGT
jgi:hypothetical protein